jgi:hypothetical protein
MGGDPLARTIFGNKSAKIGLKETGLNEGSADDLENFRCRRLLFQRSRVR